MAGLDVKLIPIGGKGVLDLEVVDGEITSVEGLQTSLDVSLLTDKRASSPAVSDPLKARGWIIDTINGDEIGSHFWLLTQARLDTTTINQGEAFGAQALQHFIDDGFATEVKVEGTLSPQGASFAITITTPFGESIRKIVNLWELTGG